MPGTQYVLSSVLTCRNPNVARRAQISADAGDAPAEYVLMAANPRLTLALDLTPSPGLRRAVTLRRAVPAHGARTLALALTLIRYVPSGPRRGATEANGGRAAAAAATEQRRNSRKPPPQPQRKLQQQQSPAKRGVSSSDGSLPVARRPACAGPGQVAPDETSGDARTYA